MSITKLTSNGLTGSKYDTVSADNYYMEPIATQLLASTASSVTFNSIPNTYKHLQLRILYDVWASSNGDMKMRFNADSGTNYSRHGLYGNGANALAYSSVSDTYIGAGYAVNAGAVSVVIIDILDYANVYKYKTTRTLEGRDRNGSGDVALSSGSWLNTAAITKIEFTPPAGTFPVNSRFSLYGIRG